eukprot:s3549_g2.t1
MALGLEHSVLLLSDGDAVAFGRNSYGQCEIPELPDESDDEPASRYIGASAGISHTALLRSDGQAVVFGSVSYGECEVPELPTGTSYVQVVAGYTFTLLLRSDGAAVAFGDNSAGQCDLPEPLEDRGYVAAAAGRTHAVLIREDGSAVAWGLNKSGSCTVPSLPEGVRYIEAAAGGDHTVLIRDDGQAVAFGHNGAGQCELPPLPEGLRYVSCAAGWTHTVLLRDDGVALCVGGNGRGQCNIPQGLASNCVAIAAGGAHTLLLCSGGRAVLFGDDKCGQCAPPDISDNLGCVASATARAVLVATLGVEEARHKAASRIADFDEEDLARLAWAYATLDLAPPELTRLLVEEAGKRAAPSRGPSPAPPRDRHNFSPSSRSRPPAEAAAAPSPPEPRREEKEDEYPPVGESGGRNQQRRAPFARLPRRRKSKGAGRGAEPAEAPTDRETTDGEPPPEPAAVPQESLETTDAVGEQSEEKEYDALLQMLRDQLRAEPATPAEAAQAPAPAVSDLDSQGRETAALSKEEQARILDLFEARRLAEKAAGRHRKRSLAKKREKAERKLDRDYIKNEIHSAFQAQHDPGVRYYNSVAIRVHKGEKAVDAKTIEQVATAQAGKMSTRTKEERVMARRVQSHLNAAAAATNLRTECLVGGMSTQKQKRLLKRRPGIVVGTPGRIYALLGMGEEADKCEWLRVGLKCLRHLVLDEADRLVESGHFRELDKILELVYQSVERAQQLQTFVFSATLTLDPRAQRGEHQEGSKVDALMSRLRFRESRAVYTVDLTKIDDTTENAEGLRISGAKLPETLQFKEVICSDDKEKEPLLAMWLLRRGFAAEVRSKTQGQPRCS